MRRQGGGVPTWKHGEEDMEDAKDDVDLVDVMVRWGGWVNCLDVKKEKEIDVMDDEKMKDDTYMERRAVTEMSGDEDIQTTGNEKEWKDRHAHSWEDVRECEN